MRACIGRPFDRVSFSLVRGVQNIRHRLFTGHHSAKSCLLSLPGLQIVPLLVGNLPLQG